MSLPGFDHRRQTHDRGCAAARLVIAAVLAMAVIGAMSASASAQTHPSAPSGPSVTTTAPAGLAVPSAKQPLGYAPQPAPIVPAPLAVAPTPQATAPTTPIKTVLKLHALMTDDGPPIKEGLVWRIYQEKSTQDSEPLVKLVATEAGGDAEFALDSGTYIVHAAYGRAGATTKVELTKPMRSETLILNAGGVRLSAMLTGEIAIPANKLSFDIYSTDADAGGEKQALVIGAAANKVIRLNADTYQIVSHYGNVNSVVRAEVHVTPGKLTEATVYHKAAEITLKLVADIGGEALTNVNWVILTPAGDQVAEYEGTFATMVLAEGDYTVVARHHDQVFTRNFSVEVGYNREIELQATKPVVQQ
ncbi:MAG: hypothetical protein P4L82_19630 [Ancalomicrobiaceae bacterium]|nr:hypothetical protein [Ancalomicrobiaceae bacterium]